MANGYGVTDQGFAIKRLDTILTEKRNKATQLFQDLVTPGDIVDTSASSALGRLIGLVAPGESDLWEALQEVYSAFDPNQATGTALDNLVALGGIQRLPARSSITTEILTGDVGTLIPAGSTIRGTTTAEDWRVLTSIGISPTGAVGIGVKPTVLVANATYTITYSTNTTTKQITYTADTSPTESKVLLGLSSAAISDGSVTTSISNGILYVNLVDQTSSNTSFSASNNLAILKASNIGDVESVNTGAISAEANTITNITTPVLGWDSATNPLAASEGSSVETDEDLRTRFRETKYTRASNILEALYSALISLEGVEEVIIYENDTDLTDENGIPAHSFLPIVLGGLSQQIGNSIWENKPLGIRSFGNTVVTVTDSQGFTHDIGYERPNPVSVYINMEIVTGPNFPQNGETLIKNNIVDYFKNNFGIGDDVIYSRLYTPINQVSDHSVNEMTIGLDPNLMDSSNISIAYNQIASIESVNINITTV